MRLDLYIYNHVYIYTCIKMFLYRVYRLDSGQDSFSLIGLALSLIGLIGWHLLVSLTKISRVQIPSPNYQIKKKKEDLIVDCVRLKIK